MAIELAITDETPQAAPNVELAGRVDTAMRRAFNLGQTYWQQADSQSYAENRRSDATRQKFEEVLAEIRTAVLEAHA